MQTKSGFYLAVLIICGVMLMLCSPAASIHAVSRQEDLRGEHPSGTQKPESKLTQKVEDSDKYGKGGKLETVSDEKYLVVFQAWYDKNKKQREVYTPRHYDHATKIYYQQWEFYEPGKSETLVTIQFDPNAGSFTVYTEGKNTSKKANPAQAEAWVAQFEKRFAEDGTISAPWDDVATTVEQPSMPPTEVFNKPKETKPESKSEEPKKEEPPKTDKTSTGDKTASSVPTFTAPGYDVKLVLENGLLRVHETTPFGGITINMPGDVQPGQTFGGTIWLDPAGRTEAERETNRSKLDDLEFRIGKDFFRIPNLQESSQKLIPWGPFHSTPGRLVLLMGDKLVFSSELPEPLKLDIPTTYSTPTVVQQGSFFTIRGPFDGSVAKTDFVEIGGERVPILAESPSSRVVWNTSNTNGLTQVEISENGQTGACPFHNVGVKISATNLRLRRGQTATVTVTFSGLGKLNQDVPYDLVNHSPTVVSMQGGQEAQNRLIPAGKVDNPKGPQGGTYTDQVSISGVAEGAFTITATVRWKETCNLPPEAMHKNVIP